MKRPEAKATILAHLPRGEVPLSSGCYRGRKGKNQVGLRGIKKDKVLAGAEKEKEPKQRPEAKKFPFVGCRKREKSRCQNGQRLIPRTAKIRAAMEIKLLSAKEGKTRVNKR